MDRAEVLQHRGSTFIECGFHELSTTASQEKKEGKSQKHEPQTHSNLVVFPPQTEVHFQQILSLFFFPHQIPKLRKI